MRRSPTAVLVGAVAAALVIVAPADHVAHADDDGLDITSATSFTVAPADSTVHVVADVTLRNTTSSEWVNGRLRTYYYTGFSWPMPAGARNTVATTGSRTLQVDIVDVPEVDSYFYIGVRFARNLGQGETTRVHLEFDMVGLPPRSAGYNRINPAYAGFDAFGAGDPGQMRVTFVFPTGWDADVLGADVQQSTQNGRVVYTVTRIADEEIGFSLFVSARRDDALVSSSIVLGEGTGAEGTTVDLRSWPGDDEWSDFVSRQLDEGLATLVAAIGRPWPEDDGFVIREAYTPYLYGYAGWYRGEDAEIEIGEDLDAETVLHELSHAWFNDAWFADRWITEGLAQEYSNSVLESLGAEFTEPDDVPLDDEWAIALEDWGAPDFVNGADGYEDFGYAASFRVIDLIVDEVGDEAMRDVFAAADTGAITYVGDTPPEEVAPLRDWREFLDLLEIIGGSTSAESLFTEWALTPTQIATLEPRGTAREAYAALDRRGGDWAPPFVVRVSMSHWNFGAASDQTEAAHAALDARAALEEVTVPLGLQLPSAAEADYEAADSIAALDDVAGLLGEMADAAAAVQAADDAVASVSGPIAWFGLLGTDLSGDLDRARAAFEQGDVPAARHGATDVSATADDAASRGVARLAAAFVALGVLVALAVLVTRRRRPRAAITAVEVGEPGEVVPVPDLAPDVAQMAAPLPSPTGSPTASPSSTWPPPAGS